MMNRLDTLRSHLHDPRPIVWAEPFHEAWMAGEGLDHPVRLARAQAGEMAAARAFVKPGELIIGNDALKSVAGALPSPFGSGIHLNREFLEELRREHPEADGRLDEIESYWDRWLSENSRCAPMTCHASLAYELVIEKGLDGMREHVTHWQRANADKRPDCAPWYEGLLITLDGISAYILAHARAAEEAAADEEDPTRGTELREIAAGCLHVAHGQPRCFREAVQLFYLVFQLCGHDSPGPIDRYLYPPLKRDLERGVITLEQAQEIVDCLWLKFEEKTAYGATIGGQLRDGSDATNELSLLCVNSIRRLRLLSPRTALRWHPGLSPELYEAACESIAEGASFPALVNDEAIIPAMVERGIELGDARDYTFVGCGQTYPHGRGHGNYEDVVLNSAKPLEYALHDGFDPMTGRQDGLATGKAESFRTFEEFERAYRQQMDHYISKHIGWVNEHRGFIQHGALDFLRSLLTHSCVERGLDWNAGGCDYAEGMVDMVGLTTATDSLLAISKGVFEGKLVSLAELSGVLDRNWEGSEDLRQQFLRKLPKFGNDDEGADVFTAAEFARINAHIKSHRTHFGGPWGMDIIGWSGSVLMGEQTGATPDGRRRGESLADCAGPAQGRNVRGVTATLCSMMRLPHSHTHGPMALSLRFPKEAVCDQQGRAKLHALIRAYFRTGGQQLQISIAGTEDMKAAQQDPGAYSSLMVRVGGFSAYFTQLDKRWQDDMIARSESAV